jgi:prophage antirepressor-like protein
MTSNLTKICYDGEAGTSDIRTFQSEDILYISLKDVLLTIHKENKDLDEKHITKSMASLLTAQLEALESDEYIIVPSTDTRTASRTENFVTQPGLYRVLSSDRSKAGKRFQKWLFHDVIPSLIKHGCYPAPVTPQGSALSQMAEIVAQNARTIADAIVRQDKLESEVSNVKLELGNINERVTSIESCTENLNYMKTVSERVSEQNLPINTAKQFDILCWCENLNMNNNKPRISCPSGIRENARFSIDVIDKAISLVTQASR